MALAAQISKFTSHKDWNYIASASDFYEAVFCSLAVGLLLKLITCTKVNSMGFELGIRLNTVLSPSIVQIIFTNNIFEK